MRKTALYFFGFFLLARVVPVSHTLEDRYIFWLCYFFAHRNQSEPTICAVFDLESLTNRFVMFNYLRI